MKSILSLGLTALAAITPLSCADETTVTILEFGPGGTVHRSTSTSTESNSAAVTSLWNVLHNPTTNNKQSTISQQHAGMSIVPDLFTKPSSGIIVKLQGDEYKSMKMAQTLLDSSATSSKNNIVGHVHIPGQVGTNLMESATKTYSLNKGDGVIPSEEIVVHLSKTASNTDNLSGVETITLNVNTKDDAKNVDKHLTNMLSTLKKQAVDNKKTVVVHVIMEDGDNNRRRLEDQNNGEDENNNNQNANNQNQNQNSNYKSMYEIQTFNLYLWTAVGLFVIVFMVIGAFIDMPLMPDTLLFGETAKIGGD